jgi:hypothetical protein
LLENVNDEHDERGPAVPSVAQGRQYATMSVQLLDSKVTKGDQKRYRTLLHQIKEDISVVENSILRISRALAEIKTKPLWRIYYHSWEEFVRVELGTGRAWGYRLVKAHSLLQQLMDEGVEESNLPDSERLCRQLLAFDPEMRKNIWDRVQLMSRKTGQPVDANLVEKVGTELEGEEGETNEKEGDGEEEKELRDNRNREKSAYFQRLKTAQQTLTDHVAFEDFDEDEQTTLHGLFTTVASLSLNRREALKKHKVKGTKSTQPELWTAQAEEA